LGDKKQKEDLTEMVYFSVYCDPVPGREEELDQFIVGKSKKFWVGQTGVKGYHVYADKLAGWPERTIMIELQDLNSLQRILDTDEHKRLRREFMTNIARAESQIQDVII
jgi:phosphatidate phosphatase APP1